MGHNRYRAGRASDHGDALALQIVIVTPGSGMKPGSLEIVETFDAREVRLG